jgi:putative aminopeptidase FrvX
VLAGIFLFNTSQLPNRKFVALARQTARARSIPLRDELIVIYGDDGAEIQKGNGGALTITLVIPTRYTNGLQRSDQPYGLRTHRGVMLRSPAININDAGDLANRHDVYRVEPLRRLLQRLRVFRASGV